MSWYRVFFKSSFFLQFRCAVAVKVVYYVKYFLGFLVPIETDGLFKGNKEKIMSVRYVIEIFLYFILTLHALFYIDYEGS